MARRESRSDLVGTDAGIYQVHRGTLDYWLAYTMVGGGGRGRNNASPPAGELLAGTNEGIYDIHIFHIKTSMGDSIAHLSCSKQYSGHATIIRLTDDYVWSDSQREDGVLVEGGAWANTGILI